MDAVSRSSTASQTHAALPKCSAFRLDPGSSRRCFRFGMKANSRLLPEPIARLRRVASTVLQQGTIPADESFYSPVRQPICRHPDTYSMDSLHSSFGG